MIVFKYRVASNMNLCHQLLEEMEIPGQAVKEKLDEKGTLMWSGDKFIAIHYSDTNTMELYGTKNTNSVKFYEKKYPKLEYDDVQVVRTKRW